MDFSNVTAIQIPEGNVVSIADKNNNILWRNIDKYAYGIRWTTDGGTTCERIGNLDFHKTLPIQSKFKCCVHQGKDILYYLNPLDSRFVEESKRANFTYQGTKMNVTACDGLPSGVTSCEEHSVVKCKFVNTELFSNYRFLYSYVYVKSNINTNRRAIGRIVYIDTDKGEAYIDDSDQMISSLYIYTDGILYYNVYDILNEYDFTNDCTVELGASLNGYDGEIGVDTGGKFYQWSIDRGGVGTGNEVWVSEHKCVSYAKEVKRHIVGHNRACLLRTAFNDSKWGWIGTLQSNTAVNVINYKTNLRGGNNPTNFDQYLGVDNFRTQLGKAATSISLAQMREYTQKLPSHQVLYKLLWEALVWCWCIEYAELDIKKSFSSSLDSNGYHNGGLGNGMISCNDYNNYCNTCNLTPSNYTLHLGNNTGIVNRASRQFAIKVDENHYWNYYTYNRIKATRDSTNKILTITSIPNISYGDWYINADGKYVAGVHRYTISGLTDSLSIIFKRNGGYITVTEDGTYDVDWGTANAGSRQIAFTKLLTECNIIITIESAPSATIIQTQQAFAVPHWRGFNVFFYGDNWINIENFLSKYDTDKQRRIYYWTDDITKFDNSIDNKEHLMEDVVNQSSNWVREFNLGNQGSLTPRSYGNGKNVFHWDNTDTQVHTAFVGGSFGHGSRCGLGYLGSGVAVGRADSLYGFFTTTILD